MGKRILIVGGVTGGATVAARCRRLDESAEIIMFERGEHVSFSNCSLPYFLSRTVAESGRLLVVTPERFKKQYNIDARVRCEVTAIDRAAKKIFVRDLANGSETSERYDTLVLSPGAAPLLPRSIAGIDAPQVFSVRNVADVVKLDAYLRTRGVKDVAIVGGGFIGCELAENLISGGYKVKLVEAQQQILTPFDFDMVQLLHKEMLDRSVELTLGESAAAITEGGLTLAGGRTIQAGAVVMAIGVAPETQLAKAAGLELGSTGAIRVNESFRTNDPDIYAVGDAVEVINRQTGKPMKLALAWPAQTEARIAADAIYGRNNRPLRFIGSSVVRVFDLYAASTGLNERSAKAAGINCESVFVAPMDKVAVLGGASPLFLKLIYERGSKKILGAQAIGKGNADRRIDVIAALIGMNATLYDLKDTELCYAPVVGTAKDAVHMAALVGLNLEEGLFKQISFTELRRLVEERACIIDVREASEYAAGHIIGARNIPLSELRQRMNEVPKDRPVYLHCRTSQRSYNALMALKNSGWNNLYNISGSYLVISLYEAMQEKLYGKKKIVTAYNFN